MSLDNITALVWIFVAGYRTTKIEKKSRKNKGAGQARFIFKGAGYI